jgi:hypothetical protein
MLEGIKKARVGDKVIMELMYDKKGNLRFAAADVKRINRCRPKHWHTYATQREHTSGNKAWNYNQREGTKPTRCGKDKHNPDHA